MKIQRQNRITEMITGKRVINTAELAAEFGVSVETIRRDLDQLEKKGILRKTYGGAEAAEDGGYMLPPFEHRRTAFRDEKAAIAARALSYVRDGCTVALDAGSTVYELSALLRERSSLTIICVDIHSAAQLLSAGSSNKVFFLGGFLTPDGTSSGTFVKEFFSDITSIDIFMCSTDGAHPDDGLSTDEAGINSLKKRFLKKSRMCVAMIDHSKFERRALFRMCAFSEIDAVVTDSATPSDIVDRIRAAGCRVDIV